MPDSLGIAINASGWVSVEYAKAITRNPRAHLVGITSRNLDNARRFVAELGLDCTVFPDYEALLADSRVGAVVITTPNYLHASDAIAACKAGKHIILEKPPAITRDECDALQAAVEQAGITSVVGFVLRWNPLVTNIRALQDQGALGDIIFAQTDYWHGAGRVISPDRWIAKRKFTGSTMLAGGSHAVDMIRFLVGSEVVEVAAFAREGLDTFEFDMTESGILRFENGAVGRVSASLEIVGPYQFNIELLGTGGTVRDNRLWSKKLAPEQSDFMEIPCIQPNSGDVAHHPFQQEVDHFVDCALSGRDCAPNIADGLRTVRVCLALDESAACSQMVRVRP
ncbi:MAG: Gfo/Idh/MocA family oxidoreductase [Acidobacteriota bacterium]|nr:Gfo/Idh/MocA family oxidoreductase [Acidobacteriota bacterium]